MHTLKSLQHESSKKHPSTPDNKNQSPKIHRVITLTTLGASIVSSSCSSDSIPKDTIPFIGNWSRSDPFGEQEISHTSWTFKKDGTLVRDGYPPFSATANYHISSSSGNTVKLRLSKLTGPQADALGENLTLSHNPLNDTLSVDHSLPLTRQQ